MHVCFDARVIVDEQTGLASYAYNLLKHLLLIDNESKYTVLINKSLREDHPVLQLQQSNLFKKMVKIPEVSLEQQFLIPFRLLQERPDVYHYPNFDVPVVHPFKTVFTIHDLTYMKYKNYYVRARRVKNYYTKHIIQYGAKRAKKIIVCSKSTKNDLLEMFDIPEDKIEVIYLALDEKFFEYGRNNSGSTPSQSVQKFIKGNRYFLFIGQRRPHKNIERIIQAYAAFKEKYSGHALKLIIGGSAYSNYEGPEKTVAALNLGNDVHFIGYVKETEIAPLYKHAECFLFPSLYEGFGLPILESMALQTPVITSNISSMPEIAARAAVTVDPYSVEDIARAMTDVVKNKALKRNLQCEGLKRVADFSWQQAAERILHVYENICIK